MPALTIRDVRTILTCPSGSRLVVVKVETSEPGLYGLGCATFTQRHLAVKAALDEYLRPFLVGKDPDRIEDIWQTSYQNSYWRNGPVLNNAISGVDMALWDIKAKRAGMPLYQLLGGKCREGAAIYGHADGRDPHEVEDRVRAFVEQGYQYVRAQMGGYGGRGWRSFLSTDAAPRSLGRVRGEPTDQPIRRAPEQALPGSYYDPRAYALSVETLFDHLRSQLGFDVELLHDVHERLAPIDAVGLAKALEPYKLFFLEDPLAPEDLEWFQMIRSQTTTPIAMGELFNHPREWTPLIANRLIDFMRMHISQMGGITPARKVAAMGEMFGVRTAWHGPGDVSPVGHAANLHLDLVCANFGVQEFGGFSDAEKEVFPGCPELRGGYLYPNERPGLGVDIDEEKAARYPPFAGPDSWTLTRRPDGTPARP
jgi:mannonate dehydratase